MRNPPPHETCRLRWGGLETDSLLANHLVIKPQAGNLRSFPGPAYSHLLSLFLRCHLFYDVCPALSRRLLSDLISQDSISQEAFTLGQPPSFPPGPVGFHFLNSSHATLLSGLSPPDFIFQQFRQNSFPFLLPHTEH